MTAVQKPQTIAPGSPRPLLSLGSGQWIPCFTFSEREGIPPRGRAWAQLALGFV